MSDLLNVLLPKVMEVSEHMAALKADMNNMQNKLDEAQEEWDNIVDEIKKELAIQGKKIATLEGMERGEKFTVHANTNIDHLDNKEGSLHVGNKAQ